MKRHCQKYVLPDDFNIVIQNYGTHYLLKTYQTVPLPREVVFTYFESPRNLFDITPDWLAFNMNLPETGENVFEGAEFDYHIRWLGMKLKWKSRITRYVPPHYFTDIQVNGPFQHWEHFHIFKEANGSTIMRDLVKYIVPFGVIGTLTHKWLIQSQLADIFCYRAEKIHRWSGMQISSPP